MTDAVARAVIPVAVFTARDAAALLRGSGRARSFKEPIDGPEKGLLIAAGELLEFLEASDQASVLEMAIIAGVMEGKDLVCRHPQRLREVDQEKGREAYVASLVQGEHRLLDPDLGGELRLSHALTLAQRPQPASQGFCVKRTEPLATSSRCSGLLHAASVREGA
jgi:hypothetical protein